VSTLAEVVNQRIEILRPRLLDTTRRNPLINNAMSARTAAFVRIIDEKPQSVVDILAADKTMRLQPLPPLDDEPPDERTREFITAFENAQTTDEKYLAAIETIDFEGDESEMDKLAEFDRQLKDRIRELLELPPRPKTAQHNDLIEHAKIHGINPSFVLPVADAEADDERFDDLALQTLLLPATLQSRAGRIYSKARMYREERGLDVVFLAVGYLEWSLPDADPDKDAFKSPITLIPLILDRERSPEGEIYTVRQQAGLHFNPVLSHKLKNEAKLDINEILECFEADSIDIESAFEMIANKKPKRMRWTVKRQATFGVYPFQGIDQYYDLRTEDIDFADFPVLKELMLGREAGAGDGAGYTESDTESEEAIKAVPHLVLDADSSQFLALMKVAAGESVALEGPPGSGKSQTIVNAIANALQSGKRVLFVAQKATALDVVYARLQALDLAKFVLPMVGAKSDSDSFYAALEERINMQSARRPSNENSLRRQLQEHRDALADYIDLLTTPIAGTQITVHQLYGLSMEHHAALLELPVELKTLPLTLADYSESFGVSEFRAACRDIREWAAQFVELHIPSESPWVSADLLTIDYDKISQVNAQGVPALQQFDSALAGTDPGAAQQVRVLLKDHRVEAIAAARKLGKYWESQAFAGWRKIAEDSDGVREALREFQARYNELENICSKNGVAVFEALKLSAQSPALECYWQLAEKLSIDDLGDISLPSVMDSASSEVSQLSSLTDKRTLMTRIKVDLTPPEVLEAADARDRLYSNTWFPNAVEQSSFVEIRTDLKTCLEALKAAYSLLDKAQPLPTAREVQQALRSIESAGFFGRFMKPYKTALATAAAWTGQEPSTAVREALAGDLNELLAATKGWESTTLAEHLPSPGASTSKLLNKLKRDFSEYTQTLAGMGLNASQASVLLTTPLLNDVAGPLRELDAVPATWDEIEGRCSDQQGLLSWIDERKDLLVEAEKLCRERKLTRTESIQQLANAVSAAENEKQQLSAQARSLGVSSLDALVEILPALTELVEATNNASAALIENILTAPSSPASLLSAGIEARARKVEELAETLASGKSEDISFSSFDAALSYLRDHVQDPEGFNRLVQRKSIVATAESFGLGAILTSLQQHQLLDEADTMGPAALLYFLKSRAETAFGSRMLNFSGPSLKSARVKLQETDRKLIAMSPQSVTAATLEQAVLPEGVGYGRKSEYTEMALLRHELGKKRRISPRKLLKRASGALAALFPCWMMVPSAVAQHLPREEMFDLVIIDEASQMTPETAVSALMRASQALICGDTNQLPPTNFFKGLSGDEEEDEDLTTDDESVLELANTQFHPKHRLRWHYRSRHEELISFSNHYVYDDDLVIFPSPGGTGDQMGVSLVQVNGTFSRGLNPAEAQVMADHIAQFMRENPHRSLGAVVMNQAQMEHLDAQVLRLAEQDSAVADYIDAWADKDGGLEKFFVKNLENVQGDERDVIFVGTVYGRDAQGKFYQRFGPLNGSSGKRRLNVLFSRAKEQIVTFSSIPMDMFNPSDTNEGARLLKLWLQFAHSKRLGERVIPDDERGLPDSPFEEHVIAAVESLGFQAVPQVGVSNYYIDIGVKHPDYPFGYICGIECDGATYHSSKNARDRDRLREEVLQRLGWDLYRIWSTDWFRDPYGERDSLGAYLQAALRDKVANMPEVVESPPDAPGAEDQVVEADSELLTIEDQVDASVPTDPTVPRKPPEPSGPTIGVNSKVRVRYLDGPRAGIESKFWLTDLSEDQHAEVPGYTTLRGKAPLCKALVGAVPGDLVSYDFQDTEIGVEILEVES
jgi:very-short-patch-repair endonuclease/transcription elongation GreA/GreB family factor